MTDQRADEAAIGETGSIVDTGGPVPDGAFDEHHPPDAALIGDCVHCGFCLPTCPTYVLWGEEMDSPRGRIYLMKEGLEGEPMTDSMVSHWDACLGCMACVTACPSGVQYDTLIEQTRAQVEREPRAVRQGPGAARPDLLVVPAPQAPAVDARPAAAAAEERARPRDAPYRAARTRRAPAGGDGTAGASPRQAREAAGLHPCSGGAPCRRRPAHRMRAGRLLPWRQRSHGAGAPGRGLRRGRAEVTGMLWRTLGAQRSRARGTGVRQEAGRRLRGLGRGVRRR